ncbi:MAG: ParA family protein [Proteobacteria bacterium]|nr:ParA family protein [Pseudomonadota bacterium]MCP4920910.1 ParA family protein [Pseudomonadota bacterium]
MRMTLSSFNRRSAPQAEKTLARGEHQAVVIAVAAQKGGVGKTTTSVSLAAALGRFHDKKVLLVDLDPQAHVNLALRGQTEVGGGPLSEVLTEQNGQEVAEIATHTQVPGVSITPQDPGLLQAEDRLSSRIGKELVLKKAIEITRSHYDVIVIDCPPNIGTLTVNALVACDYLLIPANPTALAVSGVGGILDTVEEIKGHLNPYVQVLGLVLTRVDARNAKGNAAVMELVEQEWGDLMLPVQIGVNDALSQAQTEGEDIYSFDPSSRGAEHYKQLASCVLDRVI